MEQHESRAAAKKERSRTLRVRHGKSLALLLAGVILLLDLLTLLLPDRQYSAQENRMLAQAPTLSLNALADGSFFAAGADHLADQFAGRDLWMSIDLARSLLFGAKESGGVYLGRDGYLIQAPSAPDEAALARNLAAINAFAARYSELPVSLCLAPNAFCVLSDKLPANAPVRDQRADLAAVAAQLVGVQLLDVTDALCAQPEVQRYYRTDHHWTSRGAKLAFEAMAPALGLQPLEDYDVYTVTTDFEGTLSSKSGSHAARDTIELFVPRSNVVYNVTYRDTQTTVCSLYSRDSLDQKDQYQVFFGGNHPRIDIRTTAESDRVLLLLKDSYANCFVQFLTPYFKEIVLVDPRYYYDSVQTLIRQEGVTDVLLLYNADTFLTDQSLADTLEAE